MVRAVIVASLSVALLGGIALSTEAQPRAGSRGAPVFRVVVDEKSESRRASVVTGWVYNDGQAVAGLVRMRAELLDDSGKPVSEHVGWAYGNVTPGGRAYFLIPVPPQSAALQRRVTVESWVIQSYAEGRAESP
jgi:hypothetical protein